MVYSNKFVVCVLVNGNPQNELANGVVKLPFGTEYSLRFRNKHNRRAVVKIFIDGENVSGGGYIIPANDHIDIKRHWDKDRSFKFVSLDSGEAVDAGKNGPNPDKSKGLIEAHFYLEKSYPIYNPLYTHEEHHHHHHHHYPKPDPWRWPIRPYYHCSGGTYGADRSALCGDDAIGSGGFESCKADFSVQPATKGLCAGDSGTRMSMTRSRTVTEATPATATTSFAAPPAPELKDGCTVMGESTGQKFTTAYIDLEDSYTTLKIFLQGWEDESPVRVPDDEPAKPAKKSKKDSKVADLEAENEELRRQLAEIENAKLKRKLQRAKKKKKDNET